jgi:hypothetical protein
MSIVVIRNHYMYSRSVLTKIAAFFLVVYLILNLLNIEKKFITEATFEITVKNDQRFGNFKRGA